MLNVTAPRCLYPAIVAYFESDEGQREFAEWQVRQGDAAAPVGESVPGKSEWM